MVYFGKKQGGGTGPLPANTATTDGNNTFTGNNTFNNPVGVGAPVNNNDATTKQYVDDALANKADTSTLANYATLAGNNTFTGNNTFNNAITSANGFYTTNETMMLTKMDRQQTKNVDFIYKQSSGSFKNYCYINYKFTTDDTAFTKLLQLEFRPDNNDGVYVNTDLNKIVLNDKEIQGVATPTQNNSVANKEYVDNIVKYVEKSGGLSFTRQEITAGEVNKYYATLNYSDIVIPNGKKIISCYMKTIPVGGAHLVLSFFPIYANNQCLIEIYQYKSTSDITNDLNGAIYCFTYINA